MITLVVQIQIAIFLLMLPSYTPVSQYFEYGVKYHYDQMEEESITLMKFVEERGYPMERHILFTEDGYILTLHRLPKSTPEKEKDRRLQVHRHPVLLVHGILQSAAFFLAIENGLAYQLADAGFDVWLANHRGSPYSKAHLNLNPVLHSKYWEFSFDEMGKYDVPVIVDLILEKTGKPTLTYIGFSMGTTMFWTFAHYWPNYMSKIDHFIGMAPIAIPSGLKFVANRSMFGFITTALKALNFIHFWEFRPYRRNLGWFVRKPCGENPGKPNLICKAILKMVCAISGMRESLLDYQVTVSSLPFMSAGSSLQSLYHLVQVGMAHNFQKYDYGNRLNMLYYSGRTIPPDYDLSRVTTPVFLIQGGKDEFSVPGDTDHLKELLGKNTEVTLLFEKIAKEYNHLDFFFAENVNTNLYEPLVSHLFNYTSQLPTYQRKISRLRSSRNG